MLNPIEKLVVIDGETLQDMRFQLGKFTIDTLLPQGISMLGGAPKNGKILDGAGLVRARCQG